MWRYLVVFLLAISLVRADDVLLFGNDETVLLADAQLIVNDFTFTVDAINPVNGSILDRDSFDAGDVDVITLVASVPPEFPDGTNVVFMANITQPNISGQTNLILGYNNSSSGIATLYFNPNSTSYAGNWTWFAKNINAITNEARNVIVKGSYVATFSSASLDPNASYFQNDSIRTRVNLTSNGPESRAELDADYNTIVNAQITNSTGSSALTSLPFVGGVWDASYILLTLKGVGLWNNTLLSAADFFYTPTTIYREFTVLGFMNVTDVTSSPPSIPTFSYATTICTVLDQDTNYAVPDANVTFFVNGTEIGSNFTDLSGIATITHAINVSGVVSTTCVIVDQPTIFYATGDEPSRNGTISVLNQGPMFTDGIDDHSDATNLTNAGGFLNFTSTASDPESGDWYILVCSSNATLAGSCTATEYCRSGLVTSGSSATCSLNTSAIVPEVNNWWAFPCDNSGDCGAAINTTSPFNINHAPVAHPHIAPTSPNAFSNLTCNANATDLDLGDSISADYAWWRHDESLGPWDLIVGQTSNQLLNSQFDSNDQVLCMVAPTDAHGFAGSIANSTSVTIGQGALSASAGLSAPNVTTLYSVTLSVSCTVAIGDSEDVTLTIEDDHTGSYALSSVTPADISVNTSSISLGRIASGASATHQVRILGETAGMYNVRARCTTTDTTPTTATSSPQTLTVLPDLSAPIISSVAAEPTNESINVTWTTDDLSDSSINYGTTMALGSTVFSPTYTNTHALQITGLSESIDHYYNITSCNSDGQCSTAGVYSTRTSGPEQAFPNEGGYFTGAFVERGPEAPTGSIAKGDVFEIYMESPQGLDSQDEVTVIITVKGKEIRKRITLPYTVKSPITVIYP